MKRIITFCLTVAVMLSTLSFLGIVSFAAAEGDFTYTVSNEKVTITKYSGTAKELTIPSTLGGYPVITIGKFAFDGCSSLTSITIPNGVTTIGVFAFSGCSSLTGINIPDSVKTIVSGAFNRCSSLQSITIPSGVTKITSETFYACSSLSSVTIPESVTSIGRDAFYGCSSLKSIAIPSSVTSIDASAFENCSDISMIGVRGSYAETFATANHVNFVCIEISEIAVTALPAKTEYVEGQLLDKTGMVITAYFSDGSSQPITGYTLSYETTPGTNEVIVTYGDVSTVFEVVYIENYATGLEITCLPNSLTYSQGET